jgi:ABC-2 type transport system permease protein
MMGAQGPAYNAAYPTEAARHAFIATLSAAPALGFMAGETVNAATPASYSVYKSITLMTMVTAIWGLLATTRLLRGQEEDGRLEVILAGNTTKRQASYHLLLGFAGSLLISLVLAFIGIATLGQLPHVNLAISNASLLTLGVYMPGLLFAGLGVFTSQLARTRGRAIFYGLAPLLILFVIRGSANSVTNLNWLKQLSPFGWVDLLNPVLNPQIIWMLPAIAFCLLFTGMGVYLAGRRDLGASLLRESDTAHSHFSLLGSSLTLALRQHISTFIWWTLGTLAFAGFITGLAKLSVDVLKDASGAQAIISKLGQSNSDMTLAFIGIGSTFTAMILLVMTILLLARIRRDEAKGYLDNILIQPVSRSAWLAGRLLLIVIIAAIIGFASALASWFIAHQLQHIDAIHLQPLLQSALSSIAVVLFTLGIGALVYGWLPRLAVIVMVTAITWSYAVDVLSAIIKVNATIAHTSLLYYLSSPAITPDWKALAWLSGLGVAMMVIGIVLFTKRDVVSE